MPISSDGNCGIVNGIGVTCQGSTQGDCCSRLGYCGGNASYCGAGCQRAYGVCGSSKISTDGSCGGVAQLTCLGSAEGNCCSRVGFCGNNASYCGTGCQSSFGDCWFSSTPTPTPLLATGMPPVTETVGFKAGIGAAAGVVGLGLIALLVWLPIRRRRRQDQGEQKTQEDSVMAKYGAQEMLAQPRHEMDAVEVKELYHHAPRYELPASPTTLPPKPAKPAEET